MKGSTGEHLVYFLNRDIEMPVGALIAMTAESLPPVSQTPWKIKPGSEPDGIRPVAVAMACCVESPPSFLSTDCGLCPRHSG